MENLVVRPTLPYRLTTEHRETIRLLPASCQASRRGSALMQIFLGAGMRRIANPLCNNISTKGFAERRTQGSIEFNPSV